MPDIINKFEKIDQAFSRQHLSAAWGLLNDLNVADQAKFLSQQALDSQMHYFQGIEEKVQVLEFMPLTQRVELAKRLPLSSLVPLLDQMHSDDFIDVYNHLPQSLQNQLLTRLSSQSLLELKQLAQHVEQSAGALMSSNYVTLSPDLNMDEALQALRLLAGNQETLYLIYIVNPQQQLIGVISLRQIIQAAPKAKIIEVMEQDVIFAYVDEDQEEIAKTLAHYDFIALPIVDREQHLLGIVTYDDAMDIREVETTEDFLKAGAIAPLEQLSLKTAPVFALYRKRIGWLVILVFGSLLSSLGIAKYEDTIAAHIVLVFFLPLLVGSGGNAGSQSATLMVRALATGDVQVKDWFGLLAKESLIALCLGLTMAAAVSILGYFRGDLMVALVLALSMTGIVLLGCLIGMSLPFILNRLKLDPASASAPLVTSICDATGVLVYLFIASKLLL